MTITWLALFFSAVAFAQSPGYPAYQKANELFQARRTKEALAALEQALRADEKLVPALTLYARIAMTMNRFDQARESLQRALAVDANAGHARFLYGLSFFLTNDLPRALPEFQRAAAAKEPRAVLYLGLTYESLGQTELAWRAYQDAVQLQASVEAYLAGARLQHVLGNLEECARWIERATALDANSRDAHFERARLFLRLGQTARAAQEAERALALRNGEIRDAQIHFLLVSAYRESDPARSAKHAEALRGLETQNSGTTR